MTTPFRAPLSGTAGRDRRSAPWFDALAAGTLLIRSCRDCGHRGRPDCGSCAACQSEDLEWAAAEGGGSVICVIREHADGAPLLLGLVELDEGPWLHVRLVDCEDATPGSRVRLVILPPNTDEGEHVPAFTGVV
jgi:uncharacterized OB-fold protein